MNPSPKETRKASLGLIKPQSRVRIDDILCRKRVTSRILDEMPTPDDSVITYVRLRAADDQTNALKDRRTPTCSLHADDKSCHQEQINVPNYPKLYYYY